MSATRTSSRRTARWVAVGLAVVLAGLVLVLATRDAATTRVAKSPLVGRPAPDAGELDMDDHEGRFVLLNFFATWCDPCRREHDDLLRFANVHAVAGDAEVVSVVFSDEPDDVEDFFDEHGGDWPVFDDGDGAIATAWGVSGVPESYLVAPDGTVVAKLIGGVRYDKLEEFFTSVLTGGN